MILFTHRANKRKGSDTPEVTAAAGAVSVCVGKCGRSKFNATQAAEAVLFVMQTDRSANKRKCTAE